MPRPSRIVLIHASLILFAVALIARAAQVQLVQNAQWVVQAREQHFAATDLPAPRGNIYDVRGVPLAMSREMERVEIAPREVQNRRAEAQELARLDVPRPWIERATDPHRAWVVLPESYLPGDVATLAAMRGVYTEPVIDRVYTQREATRRIIGAVGANGAPTGGLELALDSILRGRAGRVWIARDSRGRRFESPADRDVEARPGDAVVLTINQELQEISQRALADAIAHSGAEGGDIVILDPHDGELRAMASKRVGEPSFGSPVVSEPFEPGSTLKPLFAAALLARHLARPDEMVNTENGVYTVAGRTIRDEHRAPELSLADVIKYSSNIGIVKFVSRLSPRQEFEVLRDYGFGMPTGVPLPGEAAGTLRPPVDWSLQSPASLAIGYEVTVTPLQLAAAYGAIANGGALLQPAIIKEIRAPDGTIIYHHAPRVVRRVMPPDVATTVREMMVGVVEQGTGKEAALVNFTLAGKSGTARESGGTHGYIRGAYTASFVGLFPAAAPQYVIFVKLDRPRTEIFGGEAAAPVLKIVLEAAIASRDVALDRNALASNESLSKVVDSAAAQIADPTRPIAISAPTDSDVPPAIFSLPLRTPTEKGPAVGRAVPDVRGLSLRAAVHTLHRAGFRVVLGGLGDVTGTVPAAGTMMRPGAAVRLVATP